MFIVMFLIRLTRKTYLSSQLPVYRSWPYLFIFQFWLTAKIYPSSFLLRCNPSFPVYLHALFRLTTKTCHHNYLCTYLWMGSWPYLFIFILKITLAAKIYLSTFLLCRMSTFVPVDQYTCSVYFFFFGITCTMTFQLIYWGTYTQIYP